MTDVHDFEIVEQLLTSRRSCRGYLDAEVPRDTIERILTAAQRTASWCNTQPWELVIVSGAAKVELSKRLSEAVIESFGHPEQSDFGFPDRYDGVYDLRRKEVGWQLYEAVGVERGDRDGSATQMLRNFEFFGAPHVAVVTSEQDLGVYGAIDCGLYVNSFMLAAQALGVGTCAQAALAQVAPVLREHLGLPERRKIVCGISFGFPDPDHPSAQFSSRRASIDTVVSYLS